MIKVVIIVSLLPIIYGENPELKLIGELNNFFDFDHNIFLLQSSASIDRFLGRIQQGESSPPQTVYVFNNNSDRNITQLQRTEIRSKHIFTIVVFDCSPLDRLLLFFNQLLKILNFQLNMKIGFFLPHSTSMNDLLTLFDLCKKELIVYVFAASYMNPDGVSGPMNMLNIFTFQPFGSPGVINVGAGEPFENFFPSLQSNFQQHQLKTSKIGNIEKYLLILFPLMNATFVEVDNVNPTTDVRNNRIDIYVKHLRVDTAPSIFIYPHHFGAWRIYVPQAKPYEDFSAYLRIVTRDKFFGLSLVIIVAIILFLTTCRYVKESKILLFQSTADVMNLLMNDNGCIKYQQLSRAEYFVLVPLTFVGFVFVNGILCNLQSYLTQPVLQPQIKTLEDIHSSPFPIVTADKFHKIVLTDTLTNVTRHRDWSDKIITRSGEELATQVLLANVAAAVCTDAQLMDLVLSVQRGFGMKAYHDPKLEIVNSQLSFGINRRFLFFDRYNEIMGRMKSAGLIDNWLRFIYIKATNEIVNFLRANSERFEERDNQRIEFPLFIVYGWIAGVVSFVAEIIWKKYK